MTLRNTGWITRSLNFTTPIDIVINAGNVPKPKHAIIAAPESALPLAKDQVKVE